MMHTPRRPPSLTAPPDLRILRRRMVEGLYNQGIRDTAVLSAMNTVPRHLFVQEALRGRAYDDCSLPIGHGQTISQPYVVALMTELLQIEEGMSVLEVGTGSGYQAAVLAQMGCKVCTVERVRELYQTTSALLRSVCRRPVYTKLDDGTLGMPETAPFDRIIVTAGGPQVPQPLLSQLIDGGILVIPVGERKREQRLLRVCRQRDVCTTEDVCDVVFVDLVGSYGW